MKMRYGYSRGRLCFVVGWVAYRSYPRAARELRDALKALHDESALADEAVI